MSNCEKSRSGKKFVVHNAFWDECEAIIEELETSFLEELVEAKKRELERCHHPSTAEENTYNVSNVQQVMKIQSNHTDKNRSNKKKGKKKNKKKRAPSTSSSSSVSSTSSSEDQFQSKSRRSRSRKKSRSKSVVRSKDPSRPHSRARSPQRSRDRSRPYSRSRSRSKSLLRFRGRSRSKTRPHSRNRSPSFQRKHSRSPISRRRHSRSPFLDRSRSRSKPHRYDQHSRSRSKSRSKTSERQLGNQFGGSRKNGFPGRGRGHGRGRGGGWQGGSKKSYQHNSLVTISDDESEAIIKPTLNGRFSPPKALNTNNAGNDDWDDFFGGGSATQNPHQRNPPQQRQSPPRPVEVVQPTRIVIADSDDEFNEFFGTKKVARSPPRKQNNRDPRLQNLPPPINDSAMTQAISHALQEDNDPFFAPSTSKMTYIDFSPIQVPRAPPKRLSPLPIERDSHGSAEVFYKDVDFASVRAPKAPPKMLSPLPEEPVSVPYMNEDEPSKNTGADTDYSDCEMELEFPELSPQSGEVNEEALPTVEKVPPLLEKSFVSWDEPPPIASIVSKGATPMEKEASPTVKDASLNTAQSPSMTNEVSPIAAPEATKEATSPLSEALLLNEAASQILSSEIQTELQGAAPNPATTIEEPPEGSPIEPGTPLQDENEPSVNEAAITFENNQEEQRSSTPLEDEEYDLTQEPPTKETIPPSSGTPLRDEQAFDSVLELQNNDNPIGNEAITVATPSVEINSDESLLLYIDEASKDSHSQWLDYPLEENSSPLPNAEEPTSNEQTINLALDPKTKEIPAGNVAIPEADESSKDSLTQLADYHLADVGPPTISDEELAAIVRQNKLLEEQPPASPVVDLTGDSPVVRQFVREKTATPPPRKTQLVLTVTDDEVTESFVPVSPEKRLDKEVLAFSPASAAGKENQNLSNSQEEFFM